MIKKLLSRIRSLFHRNRHAVGYDPSGSPGLTDATHIDLFGNTHYTYKE